MIGCKTKCFFVCLGFFFKYFYNFVSFFLNSVSFQLIFCLQLHPNAILIHQTDLKPELEQYQASVFCINYVPSANARILLVKISAKINQIQQICRNVFLLLREITFQLLPPTHIYGEPCRTLPRPSEPQKLRPSPTHPEISLTSRLWAQIRRCDVQILVSFK